MDKNDIDILNVYSGFVYIGTSKDKLDKPVQI
jgi:hypothetical protein